MKAVVLETKNGYAAVLREDGTVVKIRRRCEVGETIRLSAKEADGIRQTSYARMIRNIAVAAAVVLAVLAGTSTYYLTATSAASVEIDTGGTMLMLSLNHFHRVIGISSDREEDAELISAIDAEGIRNHTLEEALQKTTHVISGRTQTDTQPAAQITIQTASDRTYEQLRGQAEKGGFSVKRKGTADDGRHGDGGQDLDAPAMEMTGPEEMDDPGREAVPEMKEAPETEEAPEMRADIKEHTGKDESAGPEVHEGPEEYANADERAGREEYAGREEARDADLSGGTDHAQETGKNGASAEEPNGRNEMAEAREEAPASEPVWEEGESSGEKAEKNAEGHMQGHGGTRP